MKYFCLLFILNIFDHDWFHVKDSTILLFVMHMNLEDLLKRFLNFHKISYQIFMIDIDHVAPLVWEDN